MPDSLQITHNEGVARIALDRGQVHNAFDSVLIAELTVALLEAETEPDVRAVVLTGNGTTFSAGADLNWMRGMAQASEADNRIDSERLATLMRTLNFLSKPTIARINGSAYGGGVGLVACCDIAIAVEGAKFGLTEVRLGLVPAVISPYVIAAIGARAARRYFVSGEIFESAEAQRIGLVHQVVQHAQLDAQVEKTLHWLGKGGPQAQAEAKQLALRMSGQTRGAAESIDLENAALIARLRVASEGQAGLAAFLDKRAAPWATKE